MIGDAILYLSTHYYYDCGYDIGFFESIRIDFRELIFWIKIRIIIFLDNHKEA